MATGVVVAVVVVVVVVVVVAAAAAIVVAAILVGVVVVVAAMTVSWPLELCKSSGEIRQLAFGHRRTAARRQTAHGHWSCVKALVK